MTAIDRQATLQRIRLCIERGEPWAANDLFVEAGGAVVDDPELIYLGALAHARAGAFHAAQTLLARILSSSAAAPAAVRRDAFSLRGRLAKDRFARAASSGFIDVDLACRARSDYAAAFAIDGDPHPGVNAATLARLIGHLEESHVLAQRIEATLAAGTLPRDSWAEASSGEALLLLGRFDDAQDAYARASSLAVDHLGSIASMRRQLRLIERVIPEARAIREGLPAPIVVGFAGHMIDRRDRAEPRFPATLESVVGAELRKRFAAWPKAIVYASAACGADILCLEAALDAGAEINIVMPFHPADFIRTSVAFAGGDWIARFDRVLANARRVVSATEERYLGDDLLFEHAQRLVGGLATLRAVQLELVPTMLFVVDPSAAGFVGGTRDEFERWSPRRARIEVVDLGALRRATPEEIRESGSDEEPVRAGPEWKDRPKRTLKALLFADMAGFSHVHDLHAPLFHQRFLRIVADRIAASQTPPLEANTWGDALYIVFEKAADAAAFALGVVDGIRAVDWIEAGLSEDSGIRIALHAGPVFCGFDPIIGRDNYFGTSTTTTARMEPIVPPNVVYASEAFAATLTVEEADGFVCEYVGDVALAKQYGKTRVFRIERS